MAAHGVKGHLGITVNQATDKLLKHVAMLKLHGPQPVRPIPPKLTLKEILNNTLIKWLKCWGHRPDFCDSKLWFPKPDIISARQVMSLNMKDLGPITRWPSVFLS